MTILSRSRSTFAEALGTCLLVATVVGSGIMADTLSDDTAISLLGNTVATGAILVVLITALAPISGAHFNPAVTLVFLLRREITLPLAAMYIAAQVIGGLLGTVIAHFMFEQPLLQLSSTERNGMSQAVSEGVATFGLVFFILTGIRYQPTAVPWLVGLYISAAYWFTSSTSFANPAVTIARSVTDTFSGIRAVDAPVFIAMQIVGAAIAAAVSGWLLKSSAHLIVQDK